MYQIFWCFKKSYSLPEKICLAINATDILSNCNVPVYWSSVWHRNFPSLFYFSVLYYGRDLCFSGLVFFSFHRYANNIKIVIFFSIFLFFVHPQNTKLWEKPRNFFPFFSSSGNLTLSLQYKLLPTIQGYVCRLDCV